MELASDNRARSQAAPVARAQTRACPVCRGINSTLVFQNSMVTFAGFDFSASVKSCTDCGVGYAGEALSQADLDRYYSTLSKYDSPKSADDISRLDQERAAQAIDFLASDMSQFGSAIEIGSSVGYFLHQLQATGISIAHGLDPAPAAAEAGARLFGVTIRTGFAERFAEYGEYDLVCLRAVLEHLLDPGSILKQVGRQLRPGAHLFIEVPDAGAFDRPEGVREMEPFGEFSNEHINYFSIGDLATLAASSQMEVVRWRSIRASHSLPGLFALLRRTDKPTTLPAADARSAPSRFRSTDALAAYVHKSNGLLDDVERKLRPIGGRDLLLYGAGNHTLRLLATSRVLHRSRVRAVIDRNPNFLGRALDGIPVVSPDAIASYPKMPIIVSSFNARREIGESLRALTSQPIVQLYD